MGKSNSGILGMKSTIRVKSIMGFSNHCHVKNWACRVDDCMNMKGLGESENPIHRYEKTNNLEGTEKKRQSI